MISSSLSPVFGSLAVAGILAVAGCGGSSGPSASGGASRTATSSAAASTAAPPARVTDGGSVDAAAVIAPVVAAIKAARSGHATLGGAMTGTEDFELSKGIRAQFTVRGAELQVISTGSVLYLKGLPGITKWLKIDPHGSSAMDRAMSSVGDLTKSSDPSTMLRMFGAGKATKVAAESVAGKPTTRYRFVVSPAAYAKAMGKGLLANAVKHPITTEVWVGSDNLPVKATSTVTVGAKSSTSTVLYSDWGKPVSITAPPASEVTKTPF